MIQDSVTISENMNICNILFVDDEPNILSALRRLFRRGNYNIHTAISGKDGLAILNEHNIDVVVSDMRMPEMTGADFLENVVKQWPKTARLLLTGFSDIESTIKAVNNGKIHAYISKPWDDDQIKLIVESAYEQIKIRKERDHLQKISAEQNEKLKKLNKELEEKVKARTAEIQQTADMLDIAFRQLSESHDAFVRVFADFIDSKEGVVKGFSKKVADLAKLLAIELGLDDVEIKSVYQSALLHEIGKVTIPKFTLRKAFTEMDKKDRGLYSSYPHLGEAALLSIPKFENIASVIRDHCEYFDGSGFPERKKTSHIDKNAQIVCVAKDFYHFFHGKIDGSEYSERESLRLLTSKYKAKYNPEILNALRDVVNDFESDIGVVKNLTLSSGDLKESMVLADDFRNSQGVLLLTKGTVLSKAIIDKIIRFDTDEEKPFVLHIKTT